MVICCSDKNCVWQSFIICVSCVCVCVFVLLLSIAELIHNVCAELCGEGARTMFVDFSLSSFPSAFSSTLFLICACVHSIVSNRFLPFLSPFIWVFIIHFCFVFILCERNMYSTLYTHRETDRKRDDNASHIYRVFWFWMVLVKHWGKCRDTMASIEQNKIIVRLPLLNFALFVQCEWAVLFTFTHFLKSCPLIQGNIAFVP